MYNKENLKRQLKMMKLTGEETILIHSSMKAIGEVEGGAVSASHPFTGGLWKKCRSVSGRGRREQYTLHSGGSL